jgi:hypothetical protein
MPKNLTGGNKAKKQSGKERSNVKHNRELTEDFVDDVAHGRDLEDEIFVGRVKKGFGFGRFSVQMQDGSETECSIRGNLAMRGKAARAAGNPLAISMDSFVLVLNADFGKMIVGVLTRKQIGQIRDKLKAVKNFFELGEAGAEDGGYEFDYDGVKEEGEESDESAAAGGGAAGKRPSAAEALAAAKEGADDDIDIDAI